MRHVEQVNASCSNDGADRCKAEHEPHDEEDDRVDQQGEEHSKDDFHLSLSLQFLSDDVLAQLGDIVHRQVDEHGHQEERHAYEDRDGIPNEEDESRESARQRDRFGRVQIGGYRQIRQRLIGQLGGQEEVVVLGQDRLDFFDFGRGEWLCEQVDQAASKRGNDRSIFNDTDVTIPALTFEKRQRSSPVPMSASARTEAPSPSWRQSLHPYGYDLRTISQTTYTLLVILWHPPVGRIDRELHHLQLELSCHPFDRRPR